MHEDISKLIEDDVNSSNKWLFQGPEVTKLLNTEGVSVEVKEKRNYFFKIFLFFKSVFKIFYLYFLQYSFNKANNLPTSCENLLAKTERKYRHKNSLNYIDGKSDSSYKTFYVFKKESFTKLSKINLKRLLKELVSNFIELDAVLKKKLPNKLWESIEINSQNLATYSYFCALFKNIKISHPYINFFSESALVSQAALKENITTHYFSHGLIEEENKINFPKFNFIKLFSKEEADHIRNVSPNSCVSIYPVRKVKKKLKKILCFLRSGFDLAEEEQDRLGEVIDFFRSCGFEISVNPHPESNYGIIEALLKPLEVTVLSYQDMTTSNIISKEKPTFSIGWRSTALCVSLRAEVIPISLSDSSDLLFDRIIYPFNKRVKFWKEDFNEIKSLTEGKVSYSQVLHKLTKNI